MLYFLPVYLGLIKENFYSLQEWPVLGSFTKDWRDFLACLAWKFRDLLISKSK